MSELRAYVLDAYEHAPFWAMVFIAGHTVDQWLTKAAALAQRFNDRHLQGIPIAELPMKLTQTAFAERIGWTKTRLNELIRGKRGITADSALDLAEALGTSPKLWMNLQATYDLDKAIREERWLDRLTTEAQRREPFYADSSRLNQSGHLYLCHFCATFHRC